MAIYCLHLQSSINLYGQKKITQTQILCKFKKSKIKKLALLAKKTGLGGKTKFGLNLCSYCDHSVPDLSLVTAKGYKDKENCLLLWCLRPLWGMFKSWNKKKTKNKKPRIECLKKEMVFVEESSGNQHSGSGEPCWKVVEDDYG